MNNSAIAQKEIASKVEKLPTGDLIPYARNARTHSGKQVAGIAASIREFGFMNPILIDGENGIIAGHGRVLAAEKLGLELVPCLRANHLTETQRRAYVIADNKLAENAGWDDELLRLELVDLQSADFDLGLTGFSEGELAQVMAAPTPEGTDDPAPPLTVDTIIRPGDLWLLGKHRLLCGDATKEADVKKLLDAATPFIMVTDPPYGVEYDPDWRTQAAEKGLIAFGTKRTGKVQADDRVDWTPAWRLFPGDVAYVWHASLSGREVPANLKVASLELRSQIIWRKSSFAISRGHYHWQHEPCWYAVRKGKTARWAGDRSQSTVWDIAPVGMSGQKDEDAETDHGTQKPLECMARPIRNHGKTADGVYDPFLGSGTTLIAAEKLDRVCYAIEIDPRYCDVSIRRWQELTGGKATRASDGSPFDELAYTPAPARAAKGKK